VLLLGLFQGLRPPRPPCRFVRISRPAALSLCGRPAAAGSRCALMSARLPRCVSATIAAVPLLLHENPEAERDGSPARLGPARAPSTETLLLPPSRRAAEKHERRARSCVAGAACGVLCHCASDARSRALSPSSKRHALRGGQPLTSEARPFVPRARASDARPVHDDASRRHRSSPSDRLRVTALAPVASLGRLSGVAPLPLHCAIAHGHHRACVQPSSRCASEQRADVSG
jgi:hypothetical protein